MHPGSARPTLSGVVALAVAAGAAAGQAPPDYGLDWVTVGDPGNRGTLPDEAPGLPAGMSIGSVPYKYRMTRTEITAGQWFEFVQAYAPFYEGPNVNIAFTGPHIDFVLGSYVLVGPADAPTRMSWEYAARLCNWYTNSQVNEAWAFESGAYDTSTFTQNPDGTWNHQAERSPGALFFLPTLDEWTKASAWAPDLDRYWYRQGSQDEPLISGFPEDGGETNAGPNGGPVEVGSYPDVMSPWGLLDTSGGVREWTETIASNGLPQGRYTRGSSIGAPAYEFMDAIDTLPTAGVFNATSGLRLASVIPTPSPMFVLGLFGLCSLSRRR